MYIPYRLRLLKRELCKRRDGEAHLRQVYQRFYGKELDTENPATFSEKLFTRMVTVNRHGDKRFTRLANKYLVRDYVREKVGENYLVKLLWSGTDPRQIPFNTLPPKCVLKTNHGSGSVVIFDEAADSAEVIQTLQKWLRENYYWTAREYHYYSIPRRILVEEFLDDGTHGGPLDYRFWCFNGQPEVIQIDNHAHDINPFYDTQWEPLDLTSRRGLRDCMIEKPANFQEMLAVAAALSADFDFVRVDLYSVAGKTYFGELTFTPGAGTGVLMPRSWDDHLGRKWVDSPGVSDGRVRQGE